MADPTPAHPSKKARCPRCGKTFNYQTVSQHKTFPFCSKRCRDVDLGNWMMGNYKIPGAPLPPADPEDTEDAT